MYTILQASAVPNEVNKRLQDAIRNTNDNMGEMTVVQKDLDFANLKMKAARKKLEECRN